MGSAKHIGNGWITAKMYSLGSYPGIVDGNGRVFGEVYELHGDLERRIDQMETGAGYEKKEVVVETTAGKIKAFTYFYKGSVNEANLIPGGDWVKYKEGK